MKITKRISEKFEQINETIAKKMTLNFGTMLTCYIFMFYGLLPLIPFITPYMAQMLYWSNWIQLWSLPLIIVGQNILGRDSERRAAETHGMVKAELQEVRILLELEHNQALKIEKMLDGEHQQNLKIERMIQMLEAYKPQEFE